MTFQKTCFNDCNCFIYINNDSCWCINDKIKSCNGISS